MENKSKYNNGIDVLRIVATLMVIGVHFCGNIFYAQYEPLSFKWLFTHFIAAVTYSAVNIYALISGYVKAGRTNRVYRGFQLWVCAFTWSMISLVCTIVFQPNNVSLKSAIIAFFPFLSGKYWYFTAYMGLMIIQPFLSEYMESLSIRQTRKMLAIVLVPFSIIGWLGGVSSTGNWLGVYEGYSTLWLAILYCAGYAYRRFGDSLFSRKTINSRQLVFLSSTIVVVSITIILYFISVRIVGRQLGVHFMYSYLSPFVILEAWACFALFAKWGGEAI